MQVLYPASPAQRPVPSAQLPIHLLPASRLGLSRSRRAAGPHSQAKSEGNNHQCVCGLSQQQNKTNILRDTKDKKRPLLLLNPRRWEPCSHLAGRRHSARDTEWSFRASDATHLSARCRHRRTSCSPARLPTSPPAPQSTQGDSRTSRGASVPVACLRSTQPAPFARFTSFANMDYTRPHRTPEPP